MAFAGIPINASQEKIAKPLYCEWDKVKPIILASRETPLGSGKIKAYLSVTANVFVLCVYRVVMATSKITEMAVSHRSSFWATCDILTLEANISMALCNTAVNPLLTHWSYCSLQSSFCKSSVCKSSILSICILSCNNLLLWRQWSTSSLSIWPCW